MKCFNLMLIPRWPRLPLKSPGTKPRTLPGKQHPNPLPSIGKSGGRPSKEEISPLGSPGFGSPVAVFRQSPVSTPVTPGYQTSPRTEEGGVGSFREDPVKVSVILPQVMSLCLFCISSMCLPSRDPSHLLPLYTLHLQQSLPHCPRSLRRWEKSHHCRPESRLHLPLSPRGFPPTGPTHLTVPLWSLVSPRWTQFSHKPLLSLLL